MDRQEELPMLRKEFVPIYKEGNKTDCSNYTISYKKKFLSPRLTPYINEMTVDHQHGF
jgi:hypothetical protein